MNLSNFFDTFPIYNLYNNEFKLMLNYKKLYWYTCLLQSYSNKSMVFYSERGTNIQNNKTRLL